MCGMELNVLCPFVLFHMMICNFLGRLISKEEQKGGGEEEADVGLFHSAHAGGVEAAESSLKTQKSGTASSCSWLSQKC